MRSFRGAGAYLVTFLLALVFAMHLPSGPAIGKSPAQPLRVVATTSIVADLVTQVAQQRAEVHTLLRPGADPHTYQPLPADIRTVAQAQVLVLHGAGLDTWAERLATSSGATAQVVRATAGLQALVTADGEADPHFWFDPNLVIVYVQNILEGLVAADPGGAQAYRRNAAAFVQELRELDTWITATLSKIPQEQRKLVTNHDSFRYFAARYQFSVIGTVFPGINPEAEPSARQMAALVSTIRREDVKAIFTETTANAALAQAVARELGHQVRIVRLYTGSLSEKGGPADTYVKFMRHNVKAIAEGIM